MIGGHCFRFNAQQTSLPTRERQISYSHRTQKDQKGRDGYMRLTGREGVRSKTVKKEGRKKTRRGQETERGSRETEISKAINNELIKHRNWYEEKEFEVLQKTMKRV